jgi:predicted SnoaL-like aldol condensation-catalyzing enzyme
MKKTILPLLAALALPTAALAQTPVTAAQDQMALVNSGGPAQARNKKIVYDFWREVFVAGDMTKLNQYMAEDYIQHNPLVANGREPFRAFFSRINPTPKPVQPTIADLVSINADRDMVVLAFRRELPNPREPGKTYTTTWFDMFRMKDGKLAEHWDYGTLPAAAPAAAAAR